MADQTKKSALPKKSKPEAYISKYPHIRFTSWDVGQIDAHADACLDWFANNPTEIQFTKYFTRELIPKSTYHAWFDKSEYFAKVYEILKALQQERLIDKLPSKDYSTAGVWIIMKNVSDWRDQPQQGGGDDHELEINGFE